MNDSLAQKLKTVIKTSDGTEFDTVEEARLYQAMADTDIYYRSGDLVRELCNRYEITLAEKNLVQKAMEEIETNETN